MNKKDNLLYTSSDFTNNVVSQNLSFGKMMSDVININCWPVLGTLTFSFSQRVILFT
jgi:hypothetical protein